MPDISQPIDCSVQALPIQWEERIRLERGRYSRAHMLRHIARSIARQPFLHCRSDVEKARDLLLVGGEDELARRCVKHD